MMDNGWEDSAAAWIASLGEDGDFGRRHVLDAVMLPAVRATGAGKVLDVGCGEGRFCRMLRADGREVVGLDPAAALIAEAQARDPGGVYVQGAAEHLPFEDGAFSLVVSYLSLIDIADIRAAIPEMARVLEPGGTLLVANLNGFTTAGMELGWSRGLDGKARHFAFDRYGDEWSAWTAWRGIRIVNHHRPLSTYMRLFLQQGLVLKRFDEPQPDASAPKDKADRYRRVPWFCVMAWEKPAWRSDNERGVTPNTQ